MTGKNGAQSISFLKIYPSRLIDGLVDDLISWEEGPMQKLHFNLRPILDHSRSWWISRSENLENCFKLQKVSWSQNLWNTNKESRISLQFFKNRCPLHNWRTSLKIVTVQLLHKNFWQIELCSESELKRTTQLQYRPSAHEVRRIFIL